MIEQFTLDGKLIGSFTSIAEAERRTGIVESSIRKQLKGDRITAGGFKWRKTASAFPSQTVQGLPNFDVSAVPDGVSIDHFIAVCKALEASKAGKGLKKVAKKDLPKPYTKGDKNNVLVIGDLHAPFILENYLEHCRAQQEKFNCGTVVFIGDLIDGSSWSYHEHNPDGMGQSEEISAAQSQLNDWFQVFPEAKVTLGNHDLLIIRKMRTIGLSGKFMKDFGEIWGAPKTWEFGHEFFLNGVKYIHGDKGNAIKVAKETRISTVQGHLHTQAFVEWSVSEKDRLFGLQVGCGLDRKAYAFEYAKPFPKKPVIGCAVVVDSGKLPINLLMQL